jgi:hypothetical protein
MKNDKFFSVVSSKIQDKGLPLTVPVATQRPNTSTTNSTTGGGSSTPNKGK